MMNAVCVAQSSVNCLETPRDAPFCLKKFDSRLYDNFVEQNPILELNLTFAIFCLTIIVYQIWPFLLIEALVVNGNAFAKVF